jgi:chromosome segregation ATPase
MKKLFIFALCLTALASCNEGAKKTENAARAERDSLNQVIAQKDDEINDMMTTLIDIEDGFREITDAQNRVTLAKQGEGTNSKQRIAENFQYIQSMMQQNKDLIAKLQRQVRESSVKGDKLKKVIASLQEQMEKKDLQIAEMQAQLDLKDIHIGELNTEISNMKDDARAMQSENDAQAKKLQEQDKQLNTAWFVYGTKDELKKQQILTKDGLFSKTKILQGNFNREYFTKIDIRVDRDIKLYSKDAKVLTTHPASSYRLTPDANKQLILRITDPQSFWSTSKYLVIQVK